MTRVHGQQGRTVPAGEFKQRCLALLDEVDTTGIPIVVTKRGRPVARVVRVEVPAAPMAGSIRVLTDKDEELFSTGELWEVDEPR